MPESAEQLDLWQWASLVVLAILALLAGKAVGLLRVGGAKKPASLGILELAIAIFCFYLGAPIVALSLTYIVVGLQLGEVPSGQVVYDHSQSWFIGLLVPMQIALLLLMIRRMGSSLSDFFFGGLPKSVGAAAAEILRGSLCWFCAIPLVSLCSLALGLLIHTVWGDVPQEQGVVTQLRDLADDPVLFGLKVTIIVVFIPIAEELVFRGFVHQALRPYLGSGWTIVVGAVFFASIHFSSSLGVSNIEVIGALTVLALFLGVVYERHGSLWAPIALHSTFNAATCAIVWSGLA